MNILGKNLVSIFFIWRGSRESSTSLRHWAPPSEPPLGVGTPLGVRNQESEKNQFFHFFIL